MARAESEDLNVLGGTSDRYEVRMSNISFEVSVSSIRDIYTSVQMGWSEI